METDMRNISGCRGYLAVAVVLGEAKYLLTQAKSMNIKLAALGS
jgi:hypothetical protein